MQFKKLSKIKYPCQDGFTGRIPPTIYKIIKKFYSLYEKMEEKEHYPTHFMQLVITLISKLTKTVEKMKTTDQYLINSDTKMSPTEY